MSDKISDSIITLTKRVENIEGQRSIIGEQVDKFMIFFDKLNPSGTVSLNQDIILPSGLSGVGDVGSIVDSLQAFDYGTDHADSVLFPGSVYADEGYFRLNYGRLDYNRLSHYKCGKEDVPYFTVTNLACNFDYDGFDGEQGFDL